MNNMNSKLLVVLVLLVGAGAIASYSFGLFNPKQTTPQIANPTTNPNTQNDGWREQTVPNIGLSLRIPPDMGYREELADDYGKIRTMAFYIESKDQSKPPYQLYALFQADKEATQEDLEMSKSEMDKSTIKDASIDGYKGIEGLILGPKTRHITVIQKDGRLFSVSTIPPTQENKELTEQILATFDFQ